MELNARQVFSAKRWLSLFPRLSCIELQVTEWGRERMNAAKIVSLATPHNPQVMHARARRAKPFF